MRRIVSSIVGLALLGSPLVALAEDAPAAPAEKTAKKPAKTSKKTKAPKKAEKPAEDKK
jgi:hypothetical protein